MAEVKKKHLLIRDHTRCQNLASFLSFRCPAAYAFDPTAPVLTPFCCSTNHPLILLLNLARV